jgi:hypothetical protein
LKESCHGLIEVLSWPLLGETGENHEKVRISIIPAEIQTLQFPITITSKQTCVVGFLHEMLIVTQLL